MMRFLLLAACLVAPAPVRVAAAAVDAPVAADWRKAGLPDGVKDALSGLGYRFEDDGRVLDPQTKTPLDCDRLLAAIQSLKEALPRMVSKAVDASASTAELRKLADLDLARISSYFDASRTLSERRDAAHPVRAGGSGRRVS
ncbi:MAG: hypothetical protein AAB262_04360, partial [Elusimicrobiota bacterium]